MDEVLVIGGFTTNSQSDNSCIELNLVECKYKYIKRMKLDFNYFFSIDFKYKTIGL